MFCSSEVFFHRVSMWRFVNKRSSSSVDLDSSSLDDVRAERAAMALSVGLSWPPVKRRRSAGRHSWWQHWERALQDTLHHHELPHGVRLQRPGWWQPGDAIARPLAHEEIANVSTPAAPAAPGAALVEEEPSGSGTKRRKEQQHANTHRLFIKLCWLLSTCGVSADRVVNIEETSCRLLPAPQIWVGPPRRQTSPAAGQHAGGHDIHGRLQHVAPWICRCRSCTRARQTPSCPSSPGQSTLITSRQRTAGPRRRRSCSSRPHWTT